MDHPLSTLRAQLLSAYNQLPEDHAGRPKVRNALQEIIEVIDMDKDYYAETGKSYGYPTA